MRKINWLVGSVALGLGLVIGIVGYTVATTPAAGNSLLTKFGAGNNTQTVSNLVKPADSTSTINPGNATDSVQANPTTPDANTNPLSPSAGAQAGGSESNSAGVTGELSQKIIGDYKQDIGYFFGAWQSTDMVKFRNQLTKGYVGDLFEKHARNAESFIIQGIGLEVSDIHFDGINLESATSNAATLEATYRYVAQDYNLGEQKSQGEQTEHLVHIRVNLILTNDHWMISGETPLT